MRDLVEVIGYINNKIEALDDRYDIFNYKKSYVDNKYIECTGVDVCKCRDNNRFLYRFYIEIKEKLDEMSDIIDDVITYDVDVFIKEDEDREENQMLSLYFDNMKILEINIEFLNVYDIFKIAKSVLKNFNKNYIDNYELD